MSRTKDDIVSQFVKQVNMSVSELETWLDGDESGKAGTGVGQESGRRIVEILKKNPDKNPEMYDEEDLDHMRRVLSYHSRHLAQEDHLKYDKTREELEQAKSTISLRNWGHDPLKNVQDGDAISETEDDAEGSDIVSEQAGQVQDNGVSDGTANEVVNLKRKRSEEEEEERPKTEETLADNNGTAPATKSDGQLEHEAPKKSHTKKAKKAEEREEASQETKGARASSKRGRKRTGKSAE